MASRDAIRDVDGRVISTPCNLSQQYTINACVRVLKRVQQYFQKSCLINFELGHLCQAWLLWSVPWTKFTINWICLQSKPGKPWQLLAQFQVLCTYFLPENTFHFVLQCDSHTPAVLERTRRLLANLRPRHHSSGNSGAIDL